MDKGEERSKSVKIKPHFSQTRTFVIKILRASLFRKNRTRVDCNLVKIMKVQVMAHNWSINQFKRAVGGCVRVSPTPATPPATTSLKLTQR